MTQQVSDSQVLLAQSQYEILAEIARSSDSTISDVTREVVRLGLEAFQQQQLKRQEALERLNQRRLEYHRLNGIYPEDIVAQVRAEREKQIERVMKGE